MKQIFLVIIIVASALICKSQEKVSPEVGKILEQAYNLSEQGKINDALIFLEKPLLKYKKKSNDRYFLLNLKYNLLCKLSRYQEAVKVCVEKANIITSPRQALIVAETYLKINDLKNAINWLEKSVDRGLLSYTIFDDDIYKPLRDKKRFQVLANIVKKKNGIGLPAKTFVSKTISGQKISLDMYKGQVLLIDFWATWCLPCRIEMPNVIKCYNEFKSKGFKIVGFADESYDENLKKYLSENKIEWTIVSNDEGDYRNSADIYKVTNIPASFLIDKKGILRGINLTGNKLQRAIAQLIEE